MCGGFSLGEIVHFGSLKFIADCFGSLSLSPPGGRLGCYLRGNDLQRVTVTIGHDRGLPQRLLHGAIYVRYLYMYTIDFPK
jgi:hypothetical protein